MIASMPIGPLILIIVGIVWILAAMVIFIIRESAGGEFNMNYQKIGKNVLEGARIVLLCIFTIIYAIISVAAFGIVICVDKLQGTNDAAEHTVEIGFFGYTYTLCTGKQEALK